MNEISAFTIAESQTENDLVYGRAICPTPRVGNVARRRKPFWNPKGLPAPPVTTLTTQVQAGGILSTGQQSNEVTAKRGGRNVKDGSGAQLRTVSQRRAVLGRVSQHSVLHVP